MSRFNEEIREQPKALCRLLDEGWDSVSRAARRIESFDPSWAVIAARGSSDNAARYAQYVWGAYNGLGVGLALPSLHTLYDAPPNLRNAFTVGISQSGESPDVVRVISDARRDDGLTLCLSNEPGSPLNAAAELSIDLLAGSERAVAATKTYTNELMAIAMLSVALDDDLERRRRRRLDDRAPMRGLRPHAR